MKRIGEAFDFCVVAAFLVAMWVHKIVKKHYRVISILIAAIVLAVALALAGCGAPTAGEWAAIDAMPEGPAKTIAIHEAMQRQGEEDSWWDFATALVGGLVPGAGIGVMSLRMARKAQLASDINKKAAKSVIRGTKSILDKGLTGESAVSELKAQQDIDGTREAVKSMIDEESQ